MARATFGGGAADFVFQSIGGGLLKLAPATLTFWSARTGGTQHTDLLVGGSPVSSISVGTDGQIASFQGPDGVLSMWADAGGGRVQLVAIADAAAAATALPDTAVAAAVSTPGSATATALAASYAPKLGTRFPPFESVPVFIVGDSYGSGGAGTDADAGTTYFDRWASRNRTQTPNNKSVAGKRSDEILMGQVIPNWTPNSRGVFAVADLILNDANQDGAGASTATAAAVARTVWAYATARYVAGTNDTGVVFGPNWSGGSSSTAGAYVDVSFDGDSCLILTTAVTGSGGTLLVKNSAGTTVATITTGGFAQTFTQATRISGFGPGAHTVRCSVSVGTVGFVGMALPSPTPPICPWVKPGSRGYGSGSDALIASYLAAVQAVANEFPSVVPVAMDADYDPATMLGPTHHPNDAGNAYIADRIEDALRMAAFGQGLNRLATSTAAATYSPTAPAYTSPGATAPSAPTGVTAAASSQVTVSWTRPSDGGATITGYAIRYKLTSDSAWTVWGTTVAGSANSAVIPSGLTGGSSYDFQVAAINPVGQGAWSATATATPAVPTVTYAADTFTRADSTSLGTTETGGFAWTVGGTNPLQIVSNTMKMAAAPSGNPPDALIDDGQANGTLSLRVAFATSVGLAFRISADRATGYIFYNSGGWKLMKRTATSTYAQIGTTAAGSIAVNDVVKVVLNGSSIKCYVNGTLMVDATDASFTGTRHGAYVSAINGAVDDFQHTSAIA